MACIVFHVSVDSEVAPELSSSLIRGGPICPCVVKKYLCDPNLIPSPDRSWLCHARLANRSFASPTSQALHLIHLASRPWQSHDLSEEGINFGSHKYFLPHKDMEDLPEWGISSIPGPPSRQHERERRYTLLTHPFIPTRRILKADYEDQIIFGDLVGLKLPDIFLTGEEKPWEKPHTGNLSRPGIETGRAAWQARMQLPASQRGRLII